MDAQQQKAQELPPGIQSRDMGALVGDDRLHLCFLHARREIDFWPRQPQNEGGGNTVTEIDVALIGDAFLRPSAYPCIAYHGVQKHDTGPSRPDAHHRGQIDIWCMERCGWAVFRWRSRKIGDLCHGFLGFLVVADVLKLSVVKGTHMIEYGKTTGKGNRAA